MGYSKVVEIPETQKSIDLSADDLDALIIVNKRSSDLHLSFPKLKGDNRAHSGNMISLVNHSDKLIVTDLPDSANPSVFIKVGATMNCRFILTSTPPKTSWYIVGGV